MSNNKFEDNRTRYVVGFVITPTHVLLTQKTHPAWQAGLWNGIGGHVESGENELTAMQREYAEEVAGGVPLHWANPLQMNGGTWTCGVFAAFVDSPFTVQEQNDVGEALCWLRHWNLDVLKTIPNLRWIIPFLRDHHTNDTGLLGAVAAYT